ncbi:MAG: hypothetical protein JXR34_11630 [Bacteroidales bacterium]|nr:hypothetical protein [Bacteroidales bacterium]
MRKIIFITLIFISSFCYGQVDEKFTNTNWRIGETKIIFDNGINRIEGENYEGVSTNVGYKSRKQFIEEIKNKAEEEMWESDKLTNRLILIEEYAKGGVLSLFIQRGSITSANNENFTVIIKNSKNKEVFRKQLEYDLPELPNSKERVWWNFATIFIPEVIKDDFTVYIIDRLAEYGHKRFVFEVSNSIGLFDL